MNVLSVCSGIGAFDLGLERAGCKIVGQIEIEPFCQRVLAKHWPHVWRYGDLRELLRNGARDIIRRNCGPIDLLCGGIPCQPASVAGKRGGQDDPRWLWPEFLRLVREVNPMYVFAENPSGVLSLHVDGLRFGEWIALQFLAEGYEVMPFLLSAASMGAPHERERLWIMAHSQHDRREWRVPPFARTGAALPQGKRLGDGLAIPAGVRCGEGRPEPARQQGRLNVTLSGQQMVDSTGERFPEPGRSGLRELCPEAGEEIQHRSELTGRAVGVELGNAHSARPSQHPCKRGDARGEFAPFVRTDWPMGQGHLQYDWEEPRVIPKSPLDPFFDGSPARLARWRRAGLQAIGNSGLPQIAEIIGRTFRLFDEERHRQTTQNQTEKEK